MIVIGAGLAGLVAAVSNFQRAKLIEAGSREQLLHRAVLRFRSKVVGDACGVDFREVVVHKGIVEDGEFVQPTIRRANNYSRKVIGRLADRSIWNLAPATRYVGPHDLIEQLIERVGDRIEWDTKIENITDVDDAHIISTAPMPVLKKLLGIEDNIDFAFSPIVVNRFVIPDCDLFQTVYFPSIETPVYRASITGDLLIIESMRDSPSDNQLREVLSAFGIRYFEAQRKDTTRQGFGKIAPIDEAWRRNFILQATLKHGVYSLGRFATWRSGVLLDDVLHDCSVIKKLIANGIYHAAKVS